MIEKLLKDISKMCLSELDNFTQKLFMSDLDKQSKNILIDALNARANKLNIDNSLVVSNDVCTID
jgi:hypothetical protein